MGAAAVFAPSALAGAQTTGPSGPTQSDPNPLSTNVPYMAWRGEHLRLVKCTGDLPETDMATLADAPTDSKGSLMGFDMGVNTDFLIEDWSGLAEFKPQIAPGTVSLFYSRSKGLCVRADVISQKAGIAMIKLIATINSSSEPGLLDIVQRSNILGVHQFLAIWMSLNDPVLTELPVGGDATTLNNFRAGNDPGNDGVLNVRQTGSVPLGNNFTELGLGASLTMPNDWARLAGAMASDANPDNQSPAFRWDIHDDMTLAEGHVQYGPVNTADNYSCNDQPADAALAKFGDAVDNCAAGDKQQNNLQVLDPGLSFSRWFDADGPGGPLSPIFLDRTTPNTIGPFDPQRADETFLGDGFLNADDAPMPAARIDVSIAPNKGGTDLSGMGSLQKNDKMKFFSRDRAPKANAGSGSSSKAHNLYAPYYSAYIPATGWGNSTIHGVPVSGTDGPSQGNNFPGYLGDNPYNYWDIAHVFSDAYGQNTNCLHRDDNQPIYRQTSGGAQSVAVYTDEHGQAQVNYRPGTGTNYAALGNRNSNGGCDLAGVDVLGTAAISAVARYPYQPTTDITPKASGTINKTVHSLFAKFLTQFPKGPGAENANARIIVVHAQDVDGSPESGETVCVNDTSGYGTIKPYVYDGVNQRVYGGYDLAGATAVASSNPQVACVRTNGYGNAAVELFESQGRVVNLVGDFTNERLLRDLKVDFGAPAPTPIPNPTPVPTPGSNPTTFGAPSAVTPPSATTPGNKEPNSAAAAATTQAVANALNAPANPVGDSSKSQVQRGTLRFVRIHTSTSGKRTLSLRVDGPSKMTVRISLSGKKGTRKVVVTRRVKGNKTVKITGLKISKKINKAKVAIIA